MHEQVAIDRLKKGVVGRHVREMNETFRERLSALRDVEPQAHVNLADEGRDNLP